MDNFNKDWQNVVKTNLIELYGYDEFVGYETMAHQLEISIGNIFESLRRLKRSKFYTIKEIENIFLMINDDIKDIHAILIAMNNVITGKTYLLIFELFANLIELGETYTLYEVSGNLLNIKNWWLNHYNIKQKFNSANKQK